MSLDILLACVLAPGIITLAAIVLSLGAGKLLGERPWLTTTQAVLPVAGWCAAVAVAVAAAILETTWMWCVLYAGVLFAAAATAAGRFATYEEHPAWLYSLILLMPTILALLDIPIGNRRAAVRITVAGVAAILLLAPIAWRLAPGESY